MLRLYWGIKFDIYLGSGSRQIFFYGIRASSSQDKGQNGEAHRVFFNAEI